MAKVQDFGIEIQDAFSTWFNKLREASKSPLEKAVLVVCRNKIREIYFEAHSRNKNGTVCKP